MFPFTTYVKLGALAILAALLGYVYYDFHHKPIADLKEEILHNEEVIDGLGLELGNKNVELMACKNDIRVTEFEAYFKGEAYESNSTIGDGIITHFNF